MMNEGFPPPGYIPFDSKISGIDVYQPAPQKIQDERPVVEFECPQCGATTAYSIEDGGLTCAHCGYIEQARTLIVGKSAEEFEFTLDTMEKAARGWGEERQELECQSCGARTTLRQENLTNTCAFCGSNQVIQRAASQDNLKPRTIIPFKITASECQDIAKKWLGSSWMTPAGLKRLGNLDAFTPVYLPFWTFDATSRAGWKAEVGHTRTERYYDASSKTWRTRTRVDWRWESGNVQLNFDDLPVPGTKRLSMLHLNKVRNFDLKRLAPYSPEFLAGFQALAYDIPLEAAWKMGRQEMREQTRLACRSQASTTLIRNFAMTLDFADESWRYVLLPVYVAAYRFNEKVYQALVNGQVGSISGQRPVDWMKVWLVAAAIALPGVLLSLLGLITIPLGGVGVVIGGVGGVLLVIGLIIAGIILFKASRLDDA
jgi:predicted RNA-binding Zn-ribbon protein involved in translation (DUF1610 family)